MQHLHRSLGRTIPRPWNELWRIECVVVCNHSTALILIFFTTTVILTIRLYRKNKDFKRGNLITASISTIVIIAFVIAMLLGTAYVFLILAVGSRGINEPV